MLIYAGIDEAGYGPTLGPLCVACSAFIVDGHDPAEGAPNLWRLLSNAVCRKGSDKRKRIAVDDSKNLKGANSRVKTHPLRHLERAVLAFCSLAEQCPECDDDLFTQLAAQGSGCPWYASSTQLPVGQAADELSIACSRLRRAMAGAGVQCGMLRCEAIHADEFNRQVAQTNNKAAVNLAAALRLLDGIWRRWPREHPRVIVDRHGGRVRYRDELQLAWPDAHIQILAEDEGISRYRINRDGSLMTVTFMPEADAAHFPVALASMAAKYVRELFMLRMNRFFMGHIPELKPTAGYFADARRYLDDIAPVMQRLRIDRQRLVRRL